jgi:AcrR family transcriptional regulator
MQETTPGPLRRDARRNREAILEAGRKLFADSADVPMCQVARSAGVGQATLYRHFPDRGALAAEILGERIERIAELAADHEDDPDAFFVLLRSLVDTMAGVYALAELAREDARTDRRLKENRLIIAELMRGPMRDAKTAGTLRRDLSTQDIFLMLSMVRGAMAGAQGVGGRSEAGHRALALMIEGVSP